MNNPYESGTTVADPRSFDGRKYIRIQRIGVLSCGKMLAALYAVLGLIAGGFMALFSLAGMQMQGQAGNAAAPGFAVGFGLASIIILPLMYGVLGFIFGVVAAFIYNVVSGVAGGIEIETDSTM